MTAASAMTVNQNWGIPNSQWNTHFDLTLRALSERFGSGVKVGNQRQYKTADPRHYLPGGESEVGYHEGRVGIILLCRLPSQHSLETRWIKERRAAVQGEFPECHSWVAASRLRYFFPLCTASDDGNVVLPASSSEAHAQIQALATHLAEMATSDTITLNAADMLDLNALAQCTVWAGGGFEFCN